MSRIPVPVNWERVDELLEAGCLGTEIASALGINPETFYDKVQNEFGIGFSEYSAKKKARGEAYIREAQYRKAIGKSKKGDNTMLIWLGKQRLNQKETASEITISQEALKPFDAVMTQLSSLQSDRKSSESSIINEQKSA